MKKGIRYMEVPIAFGVWTLCHLCGYSTFVLFPKGRPETLVEEWALPCTKCKRRGVLYSGYAITAN